MFSWDGGEMLFLQVTVAVHRRTLLDKKAMKNNKYTKQRFSILLAFLSKTLLHAIHKQYEYLKFTAFNDSKDEWLPKHNPDLFVKVKCFHFKQSAFRAHVRLLAYRNPLA